MKHINLEDLNYFCTIIRLGSYRKASEFLEVPAPTLSRRIKNLEHKMKVKLLHRSAHNINLTSEGEVLFNQVMPSFQAIQKKLEVLKEDNNAIEGTINISAPSGILNIFLNAWIVDFLKLWPNVNIKVYKSLPSNEIELHKIDVAIKIENTNLNNWTQVKIFSSEKWLVATPNYLSKYPPLKSITQLKDHSLICNESVPVWQFVVDNKIKNLTPTYRYMPPDLVQVLEATMLDFGISYSPKFLVEKAVDKKELIRILNKFTITESNAYMIYSNKSLTSKKVRTFVNFMKNKAPGINT